MLLRFPGTAEPDVQRWTRIGFASYLVRSFPRNRRTGCPTLDADRICPFKTPVITKSQMYKCHFYLVSGGCTYTPPAPDRQRLLSGIGPSEQRRVGSESLSICLCAAQTGHYRIANVVYLVSGGCTYTPPEPDRNGPYANFDHKQRNHNCGSRGVHHSATGPTLQVIRDAKVEHRALKELNL